MSHDRTSEQHAQQRASGDRSPDPKDIAGPTVDTTQPIRGNETGEQGQYSGQEAGTWRLDRPDRALVGSQDGGMEAAPAASDRNGAIPPEDGRRAHVDRRTGEVHGSGSGAGGGQAGEDYDSDAASGSGTGG